MNVDSLEESRQLLFQSCKDGSLTTVQQLLTCDSVLKEHIDSLIDSEGNTSLIVASENGHKGIVKLLLEYGANVDQQNPRNVCTALMKASKRGDSNLEVIELLLRYDAQIDLQNNKGDSALIVASQNRQIELVIKLVRDHRANIDLKNNKGWTALMKASQVGCAEVVKLLLNNGAKVDQQNSDGYSALMVASKNGRTDIVKLLLKVHAKVNIKANDSKTALVLASQRKHPEAVELLLEYGAKDNLDVALAYIATSKEVRINTIKLLLEHGARVNYRQWNMPSALERTSENGHIDIIELLLDHGSDKFLELAIEKASRNGHINVVKLLLEQDTCSADDLGCALVEAILNKHDDIMELLLKYATQVDEDYVDEPPLVTAVEKGDTDMVKLLLEHGAKQGLRLAITEAILNEHVEIIQLLLEHGALEDDSSYKNPPLIEASANGNITVVKLLLDKGAQVDITNIEKETALMRASEKGHIGVVKSLLDKDAQVDSVESDGWTALMFASLNGLIDVVKLLLNKGAQIDIADNDGWTALTIASQNGHIDVVKLLLDEGAQVDIANNNGWTALMIASQNGHIGVVKLLLDKGAQVDTTNRNGQAALMIASQNGYTSVVKLLLDIGAQVDIAETNGWTALMIASQYGYTDVIKLLLDKSAGINIANTYGRTALMTASQNGHIDVVNLLLDKGAPVDIANINGWTALMKTSKNGHIDVVKLLLDKGAKVDILNDNGKTALMIASQNGHTSVVKLLLDKGARADIANINGWTALMKASKNGHIDAVKLLLDKGAKVDIAKSNGRTALMIASQNGHADVVKLLLDKGAQIDIVETDGRTALMLGSQNGQTYVVKLLLDKDRQLIDIQDTEGATGLILASQNGHTNVVKLLLDKNAQINIQDNNGTTALMLAASGGHADVVQLHLKRGANVAIQNHNGFTALMRASEGGYTDIVKLLLNKGSKVDTQCDDGYCALIAASENGHADVVKLLLQMVHGDIQESIGMKALEAASYNGHIDVIKLLLDNLTGISDAAIYYATIRGHSSVARLLQDTLEQKLLAAVELAIKNGGEINHLLLHGVFLGPPRSGKDSLMKRLMGEMPSDTSPSTGAAEKVIHVKVEKSFTTAATIEDSKWIRLKYDEEAIRLMKTASSKNVDAIKMQSCTNFTDPETGPSNMLDEGRSKSKQQESNTFNIGEGLEEQSCIPHLTPNTLEPEIVQEMSIQRKHRTPMEVFKEAIRNEGMEGLKKHLVNTQLLYLTNTGGQMEFQELLPLLVSGPSVFFVTFQLHKSITETFSVVYELPSGELSKSYQSSLNVLEAILQTLSSIAAMGTYVYKGLQRKAVPLRPKVFIIGTHKDMLDKKSADTVIKDIDKHLQDVIKSTSHYREGIIQFSSESQMIFAVNNHDSNDSDFQRIRSAVENLAEIDDYRMRSPAHWMVFSLVVRQLQNHVEHYDKCYQIAKECGIKDEKEFNQALHFIHTRMGLIRYFPHEELKDIVIIDPQILFEKVTELIVETFTFENVRDHLKLETFKNMGIFNLSDFKRISSRTGHNLTPTLFAKLLGHLRIAAPFQQHGVTKYFLPCALTHAQVKQNAHTSTIPPLIVTFRCGYCPKGLFGTLITYLINNEMQSEFEWELVTEKIYRDEVCFQVGPYDVVTIRFLPTHLEITCVECNPDLSRINCTEESVCQEVCQSVENGIKTVTSAINYINAKHSFTFYCTSRSEECKTDPHPAKLMKLKGKLCSLKCDKVKSCFPLPSGFEKWQLESSPRVFETKATASTQQHTESDTKLEKHHHTLLFGQLSGYAFKWTEIGIHLGFFSNELKNIAAEPSLHHEGTKGFLREMLSQWLEWVPGDQRGSKEYATLEALKRAVSKAGLGATADDLTFSAGTTCSAMAETTSSDHDLSRSASTSAMKSGNKRNEDSTEEPNPKDHSWNKT